MVAATNSGNGGPPMRSGAIARVRFTLWWGIQRGWRSPRKVPVAHLNGCPKLRSEEAAVNGRSWVAAAAKG